MIVIDRIRINGFRSILTLQMPLGRTTVLLGANNCGKSTVLKALELALSDETSVQKEDFHMDAVGTFAKELWVDVRFVPINPQSNRLSMFPDQWQKEFAGLIRRDHYRREYMAFRTVFTRHDNGVITKARYEILHWDAARLGEAIDVLPHAIQFVSIDAEENLREDLKNEKSFVSLTVNELSTVLKKHPDYGVKPIEDLKAMLDSLSQTLEGPGTGLPQGVALTADNIEAFFSLVKSDSEKIIPFSVLQGKGSQKSVAILSIVVLVDLLAKHAQLSQKPLFMLIAAEEPEIHLHPNAQRALMTRLKSLSHQCVVSTHSPYVASVSEPHEFRSMLRVGEDIRVRWLPQNIDPMETRVIKRLILRFRAEVLFATGLIFVEGVTEEQLIRGMFQAYFGEDPSTYGISIIGVDGKSYAPFLMLALSLKKPFCVISDNDGDARHVVLKQLSDTERRVHSRAQDNQSGVFFLSPGLAIEGELVYKTGLKREIYDALWACNGSTNTSPKSKHLQYERMMALAPRDLKRKLEKKKAEYSGFLGEIIAQNPYNQSVDNMLPIAVRKAFEQISLWLGKTKKDSETETVGYT